MAYNEKALIIAKKHTHCDCVIPCSKCYAAYKAAVEALCENNAAAYKLGFEYGKKDDKELDGTDWAHDAWHRGYKRGAELAIKKVNAILDGTATETGRNSEPWQSLRMRLFDIRDLLSIGADVMRSLPYEPRSMFNKPMLRWYRIRHAYAVKRLQEKTKVQTGDPGDEHEEKQ